MKKYKFIADVWITFEYQQLFHVGRTLTTNGIEFVACISENGQMSYLLFESVINPKKLKLLRDIKFSDLKSNSNKNNLDFDTNSN